MNIISTADPLALLAIEAGQIQPPLSEGAAAGSSQLDTQQRAITIGEPVPIVFGKRDETNGTGGILISPGATECRFENDASNNVTAYYHLVLSEGQIGSIQVRDVFQRSCRVGSHSQTYNRRAGTWTPGNVIVARAGYTMPEASYYCGTVGVYTGMSTLSFSVTIPNGFDQWNRQVHCFIRNGMVVPRLIEGTDGSSNNYADLVRWCLINSSKIPSTLVDTTALTRAANFLATNRFNCDVNIKESTNLPDLLAKFSPYFLVTETRNLGKRGLRPLLPLNNNYTINTGSIGWEFTFTEDHVLPGSFQINYTPLADRKPFCAQMIWRQQLTDDFGIVRTAEVRYANTALTGPYEQHDLSAFCTVENHAVKAGAYILARRKYITHTLRFSCRPGAFNTLLEPGDIVRVTLARAASGTPSVNHDFLYELNRVTKTLRGDLTLELTHFPVDSQGRSLVALDVAAATGTGVLLTSNKTGVGCDVNSSTNTSVPAETFTIGSAPYEGTTIGGGGTESAPGAGTTNPDDGLDYPYDVTQAPPNVAVGQAVPQAHLNAINKVLQRTGPTETFSFDWGSTTWSIVYQVSGGAAMYGISPGVTSTNGGGVFTYTYAGQIGSGSYIYRGCDSSLYYANVFGPSVETRSAIKFGVNVPVYYGVDLTTAGACVLQANGYPAVTSPFPCWANYDAPRITIVSATRTA